MTCEKLPTLTLIVTYTTGMPHIKIVCVLLGNLPKRTHTIFKTRRKFEIKFLNLLTLIDIFKNYHLSFMYSVVGWQ
jgi:hypothetical protein